MRYVTEMNLPSETIQQQVHFQVAHIVVLNPTPKTIGIRVGSLDVPRDLTNVDLFVLPGSFVVYPTVGREFAMSFMNPQLALQPTGMPTKAAVIFLDASEITPSFGAIALTTFTEILNSDISVSPSEPFPVLQSGAWNVSAAITNANIAVTQSGPWTVNATITNANINVAQSGAWTVSANITNANIPVTQSGTWNTTITNATIAVTQSGTWNANITNANIAVTQSGAWAVAANITNATLNVAQSGAWNVAANITNSLLNVAQSGTWNVNANITNATVNIAGPVTANITAVNVNLPVVNPSGGSLSINATDDILVRTEPAHAAGTWNVTISTVNAGGWSYRSLTFARIHINVTRITVSGQQSGIIYMDVDDMTKFQYKKDFTFELFAGLDTGIIVATTASGATVTASWALVGHRIYGVRTLDEHTALRVREVPNKITARTDAVVSASYATHALTQRYIYTVPDNVVAHLKHVFASIEGTTAAATNVAMMEIQTAGGARIHRVLYVVSVVNTVQTASIALGDLILTTGTTFRMYTTGGDATAKFWTMTAWIEEEIG